MTNREKAIVMAHTGICMLTGDKLQIFHKYIEDIMGRPVMTHELLFLGDEIKEKSKADFIALCEEESEVCHCEEQEPCTLDDAREDFVFDVYNILDFLPTNDEANRIIEVFDRVTSDIRQEPILDKIRTEIVAKCCITVGRGNDATITLRDVFEILDKYKAENEDIQYMFHVDLADTDKTKEGTVEGSVLDKIRAEIEIYEADCRLQGGTHECEKCNDSVFGSIYRIIDKYKAESEE